MAEKIVVSVRVRPLNAKEEAKGTAWDVDSEKHAITPKARHRPSHTELNHTPRSFQLFGIYFHEVGGTFGGNKKKT